ncbi:hypothetical protein BO83DRAFT_398526 [Aspergillus eucalypticola CBS 122712]|uniref:Uncharacterized protein n=1 Tax=Aspergillus eucalypticola (strain CBS 122712 / IBT 29274) TaxID=1448314 RepID=A0A317VI83_ASPEC|nr:uncharacterized protein BO83DRAFT_398526 [Aspergillus eucalypticola CBS 122712]PWY74094.1 hypothetical protein BO83DRAFT_398526 [Aspergillus eucalypticola CBS 122712]
MKPKQMRSSAPSLADRLEDPGLLITGKTECSQPGTRLSPSYCVWYFGDTRRNQFSMFAWRGKRTNVPLFRQHFRGNDTHPTKINMGGWWLGRHTKVRPPPSPIIIMMLIGDGNCEPPKLRCDGGEVRNTRGEGDILPLPLWDTGGSRSYLCFPVICLFWISWFEIITTQLFPLPLTVLAWLGSSLSSPSLSLPTFRRVPAYGPSRLPLLASSARLASVLLLIADLLKLLLVLAYIYQIYSHWGTAHWTFPSLLFCSRALFPSMYLVQTLDQSASTGLGRLIKQFSSGSKL